MTNSDLQKSCGVKVSYGAEEIDVGTVTYEDSKSGVVTSVSPSYGSAKGGDTLTFTGVGFAMPIVTSVHGADCGSVNLVSSTEFTCVTTAKPSACATGIKITSNGYPVSISASFRYLLNWSDPESWGGEFPPQTGDSIYIPECQHVIVDENDVGPLRAVVVEGSLIFKPDANPLHKRTFQAEYIYVQKGLLEIGTEANPYTSLFEMTLHGSITSPEIPDYGNKVLAVRYGTLDIHGVARSHTWTELSETVLPGAKMIELHGVVDWKAGEKIVIASTSYEGREAEELTIESKTVSGDITTLNVKESLKYTHESFENTLEDGSKFNIRAEVGLLSRNVVFQGDSKSERESFGAHIMLHSVGDDSLTGRIENAEFRQVGQAFQLGRYPIHFHMIGDVLNSYVKSNSIHHTYNRAVTIHGVHYLKILNNLAYRTMGHTFFIEDAVETHNQLEDNLSIQTMRSWSLLNTDQTPAAFWITNPNNIFRRNRAAGSDRYGFWFDTQVHSMGPSFSEDVCPENERLGEFKDNVAHSMGRYGL